MEPTAAPPAPAVLKAYDRRWRWHFLLNNEGGDWFTLSGYYVDRLTRANETWRIETVMVLFVQRCEAHDEAGLCI